jgi:hypothetical protein
LFRFGYFSTIFFSQKRPFVYPKHWIWLEVIEESQKQFKNLALFWQTSKNSLSNFGDFDPFFPKKKKTPLDLWHWIFFFVTYAASKISQREREREEKRKKH